MAEDIPPEDFEALRKAAARLHHLSMRYAGAFIELLGEKQIGMIAKDHPGLRETRDFIDLILLTRAEINALTKCLSDAGALDLKKFVKQEAEEYEWLCQQKAKFLRVGVSDLGLVFNIGKG